MFKLNLKIALRNLWKNKGFSLINIGGLAIGLSCCLLLLLYVDYEWSYDKQFKNIDRIYSVYDNDLMSDQIITNRAFCTPSQLAATALQTIPGIEYASRLGERGGAVKSGTHNFMKSIIYVDPSFFKIFDYKFIKGSPSTALINPNSIIITARTAKIFFGSEDPIGKSLKFDNRKDLTVTAVIDDLEENQTYHFDVIMPWMFLEQEEAFLKDMDWTDGALSTIIQLKNNNDFAAADAQMRKIFKLNDPGNNSIEFFLFPFKKAHLYDQFENGKPAGGRIDQIKLYLLLALCVLFIACINYMNLSTARSEKRAKEVGVRKTLGSTRQSLASQFLLESLLMSTIAMIIAFVLVEISLPFFNDLLAIQIVIQYGAYQIWGILLALVLVTGLLAGSYPSFYLSSFKPIKVLKGFAGSGKIALPVRKILVVVQFGCSVCMIICATVVYNQIQHMKNKPLGFDKNNLVQLVRNGALKDGQKLNLFKAQLIKSGTILSATETTNGITNGYVSTEKIRWPRQQQNEQIMMSLRFSGYNLSKTIGAAMLQGRDFSEEFTADSSAVVLNEAAVKAMNLKNPIGTQIRNDDWGQTFKIIGVMKNYSATTLGGNVNPTLFFYGKDNPNTILVRLNPTENISKSIDEIKRLSKRLNPDYPLELDFVSDRLTEKLKSERLLSVLSNLFGGFAILISCLGLLGLAIYMTEQRKKEIGVRKVLGASTANIITLLNKDFIKLIAIANGLAFPMAYILANRWLSEYEYRISIAVWPFVLALVLSLSIAVITVSVQSFKVAKSNAVDALKYE
ncbi:FtsX-like permease family protein [Pedobacter petrophilus]|uniref:FtsX-like permease family protein n=1 Tax=Pedobacter petrophilus TaxID=1908241 RepID=A0A7K0G3Q1_9SPHI|nr:ABC transporter permease [Pedobacter petrophilus]MRX78433.1 FtsX-like permease family protein [Pedobacter petrophilus]